MNQLVDSNEAEKKGRTIYQTNEHLRRLANVMEHPEFREFFNLYMNDLDTAKVVLMFMKMYDAIEKHSKVSLTPYQKLAIVKDVIDDAETREKICRGISNWTKGLKDFQLQTLE